MKLGISGSAAELMQYPELWPGMKACPVHFQINKVTDLPYEEKGGYQKAMEHLRSLCPQAEFSMHAYKCNLAEKTPRVREAWLKIARETLEVAGSLGMRFVNFHLGWGTGDTRVKHTVYRDALTPVLKDLAETGRGFGVEVHLENLYPRPLHAGMQMLGDRLSDFEHWFREIDSPWLKLCYDYGHGNMEEYGVEILRRCAPRLGSLHVHDNDQMNDLHGVVTKGTIDWERELRFLERICFSGPFILEAKPEIQAESLRCLADRGWF